MATVFAFFLGWSFGAGIMWLWFVTIGLIRSEDEWNKFRERNGKK